MPNWIGVRELAERLGVSTDVVYAMANRGRWAHHRVGRQIKFSPSDVAAIEELTTVRLDVGFRPRDRGR